MNRVSKTQIIQYTKKDRGPRIHSPYPLIRYAKPIAKAISNPGSRFEERDTWHSDLETGLLSKQLILGSKNQLSVFADKVVGKLVQKRCAACVRLMVVLSNNRV